MNQNEPSCWLVLCDADAVPKKGHANCGRTSTLPNHQIMMRWCLLISASWEEICVMNQEKLSIYI